MAYAAVVSLQQTIDRLLNASESKTLIPHSEIESISREYLKSSENLESFLRTIDELPSSKLVDHAPSERRVKDAANKLEDRINSHISDRFLSGNPETSTDHDEISFPSAFSQHLLKFREEITSFTATLKTDVEDQHQSIYLFDSVGGGEKKNLVGLDKQHDELKSFLYREKSELEFIVVEGMAGIGKTALVEQVFYDDPVVTDRFDLCLFLSIGPQYQFEDILGLVLHRLGVPPGEDEESNCEKLEECLSGKKFLIVFDAIWSFSILLDLEAIFPSYEIASCVVVTTQLVSLDRHLLEHHFIKMPFLDKNQSWDLLRETVFVSGDCDDRQLEKVGRKIAENCEGLPLAIVQVAELLRKMQMTVENWTEIAESEDPLTVTIDDGTPLSDALSLSYRALPQDLKVCLLYMGVFPKHYEIRCSKLAELWVSESLIIRPRGERFDRMYLRNLVVRSVVLNNKVSSIDIEGTKSCRLHFTFRTLCVDEARNEELFHVIKRYTDPFPENEDGSQQRLCFHNNVLLGFREVHEWMESVQGVRSFLCFGPQQRYPISLFLGFRLLKVLDALALRFYEFPHQVVDLVHLRYLAVTHDEDELPASISRLWNLEFLIVHRHHNIKKSSNAPVSYLPVEIWKLHKLKHLHCMGFDLPDPNSQLDDSLVLRNLSTLSGVSARSCTARVLERTPKLENIGIRIDSTHDSIETFSFLGDFASANCPFNSFKCVVTNPNLRSPDVRPIPSFRGHHMTKITLSGCGFSWEHMRVIATLPYLRALKLRWYAFCGPEWRIGETDEEKQFPSLIYLLLEDLDIQHWIAKFENLPMLQRLIVRHCYKLREIPTDMRRNGSLELIEMDDCGLSAMAIAEKMREENRNNNKLQFRINYSGGRKEPRS